MFVVNEFGSPVLNRTYDPLVNSVGISCLFLGRIVEPQPRLLEVLAPNRANQSLYKGMQQRHVRNSLISVAHFEDYRCPSATKTEPHSRGKRNLTVPVLGPLKEFCRRIALTGAELGNNQLWHSSTIGAVS